MAYCVLDFLENRSDEMGEKTAVIDEFSSVTYRELNLKAKKIGSALVKNISKNEPVIVYMEKGITALAVFFGIVYAGGCYCLVNTENPKNRIDNIVSCLKAKTVVTTGELLSKAKENFPNQTVVLADELLSFPVDDAAISLAREGIIDTDPLYINFTSGSTGVPKGIVVCHRSVIDFITQFTKTFGFDETDIFANQAPFDFDVSVKDIYSSLYLGATLLIVPRHLFSSPVPLLDFLCENQATVMIWAVSALCLISTFHGLDYKTPESVGKILYSGEVMPYKHLLSWREHLPNATVVNLYGPTEITCNCTYHILQEGRDYSAGIPIGKPFPNEDVFLLDGENRKITVENVNGEICVRGTTLALGYYASPEQTAKHFVQNPLNSHYPEIIYRTGDLAYYNENGELVFAGRKDFQIKYMGHRIELEEIERAMAAISGVERCCCVFDEKKSRLMGFYVGTIDKKDLHRTMAETLPEFMVPGILRQIEQMPLTKNGKIDRAALKEMKRR